MASPLWDRIQRRGQQRDRKKKQSIFVHSCPFLRDYDVKMPNFAFYGGRKQATTNFMSVSEIEYGSPTIDKVSV